MSASPKSEEQFTFVEPGEYIVRHGDAAYIHQPKALSYSGRLDTPQQFLEKKRAAKDHATGTLFYLPQDATFVVDKEGNTVTLYLNEWDTPADTIVGKLEGDPNLARFDINGTKRWSVKDLWMFLKQMGYFFHDADQHKAFLASLRNFSAKVQTAVENKSDNAGNRRDVYERVVQENSLSVNPFFTLKVPIFKGYDAQVFKVELGFDPTDAGVSIFLMSDELFGMVLEQRDELMEQESNYFTAWGCSVLTKS